MLENLIKDLSLILFKFSRNQVWNLWKVLDLILDWSFPNKKKRSINILQWTVGNGVLIVS